MSDRSPSDEAFGLPKGITEIVLLAGKGDYPLLLAQSARAQGVRRITAIAFRHETDRAIARYVDDVKWIYLGQFGAVLDALDAWGIKHAVMVGQITPTHLFSLRFDRMTFELLKNLKQRNAHTIYGAACDQINQRGVSLLPAHLFMEAAMPEAGLIGGREPTNEEMTDILFGLNVAKITSGIEIGQTVVVKEGTILAVEAYEGTDETILRAGRVGNGGAVVVKVAKKGHDMRFDIPVVGMRTMKIIKKSKTRVLAIEAKRTILLEREKLIKEANRLGICFIAMNTEDSLQGPA
ncbi:MAG: UDP-2,3-diacylglucosamine diphosphatase LpxI [bacterium]